MEKYYRATKDSFLWEKGAILKKCNQGSNGGYKPIEDIWDVNAYVGKEYVSAPIVENSPDWFERVYASNLEKMVFKTKEEMKAAINFVK